MKIFLSWSGDLSNSLAKILYEWLPMVINDVQPYLSEEEIRKGARWSADVAKELEAKNFGILCLTPENIEAPWILFEAGSLAKVVDNSRVSPLLFGIKPSDLRGPLSQFQATAFHEADVLRLIMSINKANTKPLDDMLVGRTFIALWPVLKAKVDTCLENAPTREPELPVTGLQHPEIIRLNDIAEEILVLTRLQANKSGTPELFTPEMFAPLLNFLAQHNNAVSALTMQSIEDVVRSWIEWKKFFVMECAPIQLSYVNVAEKLLSVDNAITKLLREWRMGGRLEVLLDDSVSYTTAFIQQRLEAGR